MAHRVILCLAWVVVPFLVGCAGSGSVADIGTYRADVGLATDYDVNDKVARLLDRYQYQIVRYEQTTDEIYFETYWKDRFPFKDELELGVTQARTRIIIRARPRTRVQPGSAKVNRVRFISDTEVKYAGTEDWVRAPITPMLRAYLKEFAQDLRTEFQSGFRRY